MYSGRLKNAYFTKTLNFVLHVPGSFCIEMPWLKLHLQKMILTVVNQKRKFKRSGPKQDTTYFLNKCLLITC